MKPVVFLGPTVSAVEARAIHPEIEVHPPAAAGDILQAVEAGASTIALIDGYFEHQLSVWHKEVLWALSKGVAVYGAASMGALRAAELYPFGMAGVGAIFDGYRSGRYEADDEVAVSHLAADRGYVAVSEALVNVRATLCQAAFDGAVTEGEASQVVLAAQSLFFPDRTYPNILARAVTQGFSAKSASTLQAWLRPSEGRRVDQKRKDAVELLTLLRSPPRAAPGVDFVFHYTEAWHEFRAAQRRKAELRRASRVDGLALQRAADEFRRDRGLLTPEATDRWLHAQGMDVAAFSEMIRGLLSERVKPGLDERAIQGVGNALNLPLGGAHAIGQEDRAEPEVPVESDIRAVAGPAAGLRGVAHPRELASLQTHQSSVGLAPLSVEKGEALVGNDAGMIAHEILQQPSITSS